MYKLYTDGGARPNPGNAGYGAALYFNDDMIATCGGGVQKSTNNCMEYTALSAGLV